MKDTEKKCLNSYPHHTTPTTQHSQANTTASLITIGLERPKGARAKRARQSQGRAPASPSIVPPLRGVRGVIIPNPDRR